MQYITTDANNTITAVAEWHFPDSVPAPQPVVRGWDGGLFFEGDPRLEKPQSVIDAERAAQIKAELIKIDAKSSRALRAVLLDTQNGVEPSGGDLAELAVCEADALELRAELRAKSRGLTPETAAIPEA